MKKQLFLAIGFLIVFTLISQRATTFGLGPIKIGGWVGNKLDKVESFIGGLSGKPMEWATSGSIDNLQAKLDKNINHLDEVMNKNVTNLTGGFRSNIQLLDTVLNNNIKELDTALYHNIKELDNSIQHGVDGLRSVESFFAKDLWVWTKLLAQLAVFIIALFFIFSTYRTINRNGGMTKKEWKELLLQSKFYIIGLFLALFIIFAFRPLTGKYVDPAFESQREIYETGLEKAIEIYDYKNAIIYATGLNRLEPQNKIYEYLIKKIDLIKDLLLLNENSQIDNNSLYQKFEYLENEKSKFKINDPEFYIVAAIYYKNTQNTKHGILLAAYNCYEYLKNRETKSQIKFNFNLYGAAIEILNIYHLNPYAREAAIDNLKIEKIEPSDETIELLSKDTTIINDAFPLLIVKQIFVKQLKNDQDYLAKYFSNSITETDKNNIINSWISDIKIICSSKYNETYLNQGTILDDFIPQLILGTYTNPQLDSLKQETSKSISLIQDNDISTSLNTFYEFKKSITTKLFLLTKQKFPQAALAKVYEMKKMTDSFHTRINELNGFYEKYQNMGKVSMDDIQRIELCKNLLQSTAMLNLYYLNNNKREPLAYKFLNQMKIEHPTLINENLYKEFKQNCDMILEEHYWTIE